MVEINGMRNGSELPATPCQLPFSRSFLALYQELQAYRNGVPVIVDGISMTVACLVGAARYNTAVVLDDHPATQASASIYGVNTGFGGSAVSRTRDYLNLGNALFQMQHCGILPSSVNTSSVAPFSECAFNTTMPESWIRAAMVVRMNSLIRGHSGVRWELLKAMEAVLREDILPLVPLRGSISASGDLSPLSYIAGMLSGNPSIRVTVGCSGSKDRRIVPSFEALASRGLTPIDIQPKEHLGLLNGTAFSAAVSGLAVYDAVHLALLSQVCTAMATEALLGSRGSFAPFIHEIARPHPGQIEVARMVNGLLASSELAVSPDCEKSIDDDRGELKQDRYALRTSPQFIGPQLEEIQAALTTIHRELNSSTDNPLVESATQTIHDTGNFQAMAVTNAMEKTRLSIHHLGKILFAQATEIINPATNKGLPPSLAATDPSLNYHCKGLEISLAAYVSELGYLANPVSTHIQSAEMHNQAVNSLALISARATVTSIDVLTMIIASCIYIACQALDLRALALQLQKGFKNIIIEVVAKCFQSIIPPEDREELVIQLIRTFDDTFSKTSTMDGTERIHAAAHSTVNMIMDYLLTHPSIPIGTASSLPVYEVQVESRCRTLLTQLRKAFLTGSTDSPTSSLLGASRDMYRFVRNTLGIKMHGLENLTAFEGGLNTKEPTIGENVSLIYEAIRDGQIYDVVAGMVKSLP